MEKRRTQRPPHSDTDSEAAADDFDYYDAVHEVREDRNRAAKKSTFDIDEAQEIWRIAARLQAEAAQRLENRSKALADPSDRGSQDHKFSVGELTAIAEEAGIDAEFVQVALEEREAQRYSSVTLSDEAGDRASRFLRTPENRIDISRVIRAPKKDVLDAMRAIFPAPPYNLELMEVVGDEDRLADSMLVFKVPQLSMVTTASELNMFSYHMSIADLNRMIVRMHALDENSTEVSVQLDMRYGKVRNLTYGVGISAIFATLFGLIVGLAMGKKVGVAEGIAGFLLTGIVTGYFSSWLYRWAYRRGLKKGESQIEDLLKRVDVTARTGGSFAKIDA
ncbi:MAG: hypothetical protein KJO98_11615 [Rhodothermia bacterium]|nr:hypothetical protein [Rhodothermia bacterium]